MNEEKRVKLIECFNSFQGEGVDSGQAMIILRFKTCNLNCKYCDTSVKMRISMEAEYTLKDIQKNIYNTRSSILITGGEPTVPRHIDEASMLLNELTYPVANVESNGFQLEKLIKMTKPAKNVHFIYSPKIFNRDDFMNSIKLTKKLLPYNEVYIKVVYEDSVFIKSYLNWLSKQITFEQSNKVWLMTEGITRSELISNSPQVFDACEKYKFNFSSRNHIMFDFV